MKIEDNIPVGFEFDSYYISEALTILGGAFERAIQKCSVIPAVQQRPTSAEGPVDSFATRGLSKVRE